MGRPRIHDEATRERLLTAAAETVTTSGMHALSIRSLAADTGTSTAAVYTLFGGKSGVVNAVFRRAFELFGDALSAVGESEDPVDDIIRLGHAYRQYALGDPNGYRIMFGDGVRPSDVSRRAFRSSAETFDPLVVAVRRCVGFGRFPAEPAAEGIATALWANVHGLVSLELGSFLPPTAGDPAEVFDGAVRANVAGWATLATSE